jgi:hypothetical protein
MGHKSLKTTMPHLAPATDGQDELDSVTIPSSGKGRRGTLKVCREREPFLLEGGWRRSDAGVNGLAPEQTRRRRLLALRL